MRGFWFHPAGCNCLYNGAGFLEQECFQCQEDARSTVDATESDHNLEVSIERGNMSVQP
jgi:hypothetical protein